MGIAGWIDRHRSLQHERLTVAAMAGTPGPANDRYTDFILADRTAFAAHGTTASCAQVRCPERLDTQLVGLVGGRLDNRRHLEEQLRDTIGPRVSDARLILLAYQRWGARLVEHLDGTYAIAIWDEQWRTLTLIRDPLGAKTLFYTRRPDGTVLFACRATALLAHTDVRAVVDADGLNELITLAPVRSPDHGVLRGVHQVPPGHLVRISPHAVQSQAYWAPQADSHDDDLDTTTAAVRRILADNTAGLREHTPHSVLLSGGVASAATAALTIGPEQVRPAAVTLTLAGPAISPSGRGAGLARAAQIARDLKLLHHVAAVGASELIGAAASTRWILDFPGQSGMDGPLFALLRLASIHGPEVVTGIGADAVFGGYRWQHDKGLLGRDGFPWRHHHPPLEGLLNADAWHHLQPDAYRKRRYADATAQIPQLHEENTLQRLHRRANYLTLTHYLPHLLNRLDQLAQACAITIRTPIADWLLAQYLWGIPQAMRHLRGIPNGLLHHATADLLPTATASHPQHPLPAAYLLRGWQAGQRQHLQEILNDRNAPINALLDPTRTRHLAEQPVTRTSRQWHTTIAYLIDLNSWLEKHRIFVT